MTSSITCFDSHIVHQKYTFKNLLWSGWPDWGKTLHVWPPVHEAEKVHIYAIIGHMVWQPYWIYPQTYKNTPLKRSPGEGLQSLIALFFLLLLFLGVALEKCHYNVERCSSCFQYTLTCCFPKRQYNMEIPHVVLESTAKNTKATLKIWLALHFN